jgi:hypothetical protein
MAESRSGGNRRSGGRRAAPKKAAAPGRKPPARKASSRKQSAGPSSRKPSAGRSSRRKPAQPKRAAAGSAGSGQDLSGKSVADFRQALTERLVEPLNLVLLTRERIEEAVEEAVTRGSMTRDAAQDLIGGLVERGRRQTSDVLGDLEQLLGRGRGTDVAARARKQVGDATARAREAGDQVLVQADRARRVAGVGPSFPILGYDELTASQVQSRLDTLTPAELRKVRDYEKRNANRKSVLSAIERKLA